MAYGITIDWSNSHIRIDTIVFLSFPYLSLLAGEADEDLVLLVFYCSVLGHNVLSAVWLACGTRGITERLVVAVSWLVFYVPLWGRLPKDFDDAFLDFSLPVWSSCVLLLSFFRWTVGLRLCRPTQGELAKCQFTIRKLLALTAKFALVLGVGRVIWPFYVLWVVNNNDVVECIEGIALTALPIGISLLTKSWPVAWFLLSYVFVISLTMGIFHTLYYSFTLRPAVFPAAITVAVGSIWLRWRGYQLQVGWP